VYVQIRNTDLLQDAQQPQRQGQRTSKLRSQTWYPLRAFDSIIVHEATHTETYIPPTRRNTWVHTTPSAPTRGRLLKTQSQKQSSTPEKQSSARDLPRLQWEGYSLPVYKTVSARAPQNAEPRHNLCQKAVLRKQPCNCSCPRAPPAQLPFELTVKPIACRIQAGAASVHLTDQKLWPDHFTARTASDAAAAVEPKGNAIVCLPCLLCPLRLSPPYCNSNWAMLLKGVSMCTMSQSDMPLRPDRGKESKYSNRRACVATAPSADLPRKGGTSSCILPPQDQMATEARGMHMHNHAASKIEPLHPESLQDVACHSTLCSNMQNAGPTLTSISTAKGFVFVAQKRKKHARTFWAR